MEEIKRLSWQRDFVSVDHLIEYLKDDTIKTWSKRCSRDTNSPNFYGTRSFEESLDLIENGYQQGAEKIKDVVDQVMEHYDPAPELQHGITGHFPDVPAFIAGDPECMFKYSDVDSKKNVYKIYFGSGASCAVSKERMFNFGAAMVKIVDKLESEKNTVELVSVWPITRNEEYGTVSTVIKRAGDFVDISQLAYTMTHSSFLRRSLFAVMETFTENNGENILRSSYGTAVRLDENYLKAAGLDTTNSIIIPGLGHGPDQCGTIDEAVKWLRETVNEQAGKELIKESL